MPRIIGVDIPNKKKLMISLTYIYGVGLTRSQQIINILSLDGSKLAEQLTGDEIAQITSLLQDQYIVEGDLRRSVQNDIKRLQTIQAYRGVRHKRGLPVRGQRTKTNARTRKGKKKTVAGKKK